jgi:hypothetical protein
MFYYISLVTSLALAFVFGNAGFTKLTKSVDDLVAAGMSFTKDIPLWTVRLIALLELAGAQGVLTGPAAGYFLGWDWAGTLGLLAAIGLALTMLVGAIMHIVRGEFKYTWKINVAILAVAALNVWFIASI